MSSDRVRLSRNEAMVETRRRLLDAAWSVFARQGYDGTSVKQIADEAGYTTGAIYAHFESKEELFLALLRERFATKVEALTAIVETNQDADAQLQSLSSRFASLHEIEGNWDLLATEFSLYAARHPEAAQPLVERQRQLREGVADIIARRLDREGIEPETRPELIAAAVIALGDGLGALRRLEPHAFPDELFGAAVLHLVAGLAANGL